MSDEKKSAEELLEEEARAERKFSMAEAIAREAKGMLKGASAVPALTQAQNEIGQFIRDHVRDSSGALVRTLELRLKGNHSLVGSHFDDPLAALGIEVQRILDSDRQLHEFVRQVDQKYGYLFQERPHFQRPGEEPHPEDEYTHESVRAELEQLQARIEAR